MIVRAAIEGGCDHLLTEDMHHGLVIDGVRIENPSAQS
jgi:predicted nucleic acid-binding protein